MSDLDKRSMALSIIGFLILAAGVIMLFAGNNINNNFQEQILYYYEKGTTDPTGLNIMYSGLAVIGVGVICLIASFVLVIRSHRQFSGKVHDEDYEEYDDMIAQLAGNRTIFDVFHSEDNKRVFSFYRNKSCIFKENDVSHRGNMEPVAWEEGHPTVWRVTINVDETEQVYEVSKAEGNIVVKSDGGEEVFYRN